MDKLQMVKKWINERRQRYNTPECLELLFDLECFIDGLRQKESKNERELFEQGKVFNIKRK